VREAHLTGMGSASPAYEACFRDGGVRGAKGATADQPLTGKEARHAPHLAHLDRLGERQGQEDRRQPPSEHGFARARRPDQQADVNDFSHSRYTVVLPMKS
jgi:hypothetical protein